MPQQRLIFINLPVADLQASITFFTALGFTFEPKFTDETTTCMIVSDQAFVMLLQKERFAGFVSTKPVGDPAVQTSAIFAVSAEDRAGVDTFADAALAAGGTPANDAIDMGFMYGRSFHDLDGHAWEVVWMDQEAVEQGPGAVEETAA